MPEAPESKRWATFPRTVEVPVYKKPWSNISTPEQTERMLIKHLVVREVDGSHAIYKGVDYPFKEVAVHAWVDMIGDGIALEIRTSDDKDPKPFFIPRKDLRDNFMYRVTDTASCAGVLASTTRGVWLAEADPFIPPNSYLFLRRIPLEETYGYQTRVWGSQRQELPTKVDIQKAALEATALHVKLYGKFVAI